MTVIAFDGKTLVADGRATASSALLVDNCIKLKVTTIPQHGKCVIGFGGHLDILGPFLDHLTKEGFTPFTTFDHMRTEDKESYYIRGICITAKGKAIEFDSVGFWYELDGTSSIGSGSIITQHYLAKGCDALTAVVETCKTELSCGGRLTAYDLETKTFRFYDASGRPVKAPQSN